MQPRPQGVFPFRVGGACFLWHLSCSTLFVNILQGVFSIKLICGVGSRISYFITCFSFQLHLSHHLSNFSIVPSELVNVVFLITLGGEGEEEKGEAQRKIKKAINEIERYPRRSGKGET